MDESEFVEEDGNRKGGKVKGSSSAPQRKTINFYRHKELGNLWYSRPVWNKTLGDWEESHDELIPCWLQVTNRLIRHDEQGEREVCVACTYENAQHEKGNIIFDSDQCTDAKAMSAHATANGLGMWSLDGNKLRILHSYLQAEPGYRNVVHELHSLGFHEEFDVLTVPDGAYTRMGFQASQSVVALKKGGATTNVSMRKIDLPKYRMKPTIGPAQDNITTTLLHLRNLAEKLDTPLGADCRHGTFSIGYMLAHMFIRRRVIKAAQSFPHLVIYGPAQHGKTTFVEWLCDAFGYRPGHAMGFGGSSFAGIRNKLTEDSFLPLWVDEARDLDKSKEERKVLIRNAAGDIPFVNAYGNFTPRCSFILSGESVPGDEAEHTRYFSLPYPKPSGSGMRDIEEAVSMVREWIGNLPMDYHGISDAMFSAYESLCAQLKNISKFEEPRERSMFGAVLAGVWYMRGRGELSLDAKWMEDLMAAMFEATGAKQEFRQENSGTRQFLSDLHLLRQQDKLPTVYLKRTMKRGELIRKIAIRLSPLVSLVNREYGKQYDAQIVGNYLRTLPGWAMGKARFGGFLTTCHTLPKTALVDVGCEWMWDASTDEESNQQDDVEGV